VKGGGFEQVEAVENHMPEVVIVDEIGTEAEALACRTIAGGLLILPFSPRIINLTFPILWSMVFVCDTVA
jgi:hypothetical protein